MKRNLVLTLMFVVTIVAVSYGFQAPTYIPNGSGADVRNAINNALKAVMSQHSGPTEPSNAQSFMVWVDTSTTPPTTKQRNAGNTAWEVVTEKLKTTGGNLPVGDFNFSVNDAGNYPQSNLRIDKDQTIITHSTDSNTSSITVTGDRIFLQSDGGGIFVYSGRSAPATASSTGSVNEIRFDKNYMYRCVAKDTWKRIPMSTW